ncbi:hypothetical protein ALQ65_200042 [Pseudomonas syringae pv. coriandricola]|uniref:Uncharacterized protein n=1 Tax=Pseudomonas syringae pv. coriandricola TaxID=264453 RepID=A0A3M3JT28_9PSED|nr:hypothetical protein ALQ65_200042 [Pseudomonas syringae pv. coriandricola]
MGPSNREICFWFVTMLMTGIGMLKDFSGQPKMLLALIVFGFIGSAWFFMGGLLSAMRPGPKAKAEPTSDAERAET